MADTDVALLRRDFRDHERQDEERHVSMTRDITNLQVGFADLKGYIRGRAAVLAAVLAVAIPILTEIVHALFSPSGVAKQ